MLIPTAYILIITEPKKVMYIGWFLDDKQWGNTNRTITYHISVSNVYVILALDSGSDMRAAQIPTVLANSVGNLSATVFQFMVSATEQYLVPNENTNQYWLMLGHI